MSDIRDFAAIEHEIKAVTFRSLRVQRNGVRYTYRIASVHCTCGLVNERQSDWYSAWDGESSSSQRKTADAQALAGAVTKHGWHIEPETVAS